MVENYLYEFRRLFPTRDLAEQDGLRQTHEAIRAGDIRFAVIRVDNWTNTRCSERSPTALTFEHLLRLFRTKDGVELGRAVQRDDGFLATWQSFEPNKTSASTDEQRVGFLELGEALARVRSDLALVGRDPQYVSVIGRPFSCEAILPCVAFRAGNDTYLISFKHDVVVIPSRAERLDHVMRTPLKDRMDALAALRLGDDESLVSLGGERYARGRLVGRLRKR